MKQSAVVVVVDPAGCVLMLRRSGTDPWKPGHWNFPGGRVDSGESTKQAAYRELAEESGICLSSGLRFFFRYRANGWLTTVYTLRLARRPVVSFPDKEHDAYAWVELHSLPHPCIPGIGKIVSRVAQRFTSAPRLSRTDGRKSHRRTPMSKSWPNAYPYWPKYLPYPTAIRRGMRPVPNASSVHSPQAQFAPLYLAPGSASFQPYSYSIQDVPLYMQQPHYTAQNKAYLSMPAQFRSGYGPAGDIAQLPRGYGDYGQASAAPAAEFVAEPGQGIKEEVSTIEKLGLRDPLTGKLTPRAYAAIALGFGALYYAYTRRSR